MPKKRNNAVFVFTDTPDIYGDDLNHEGLPPTYVREIDALLDMLRSTSVAGLALEVPKVMSLSRQNRDRLFSYAEHFPLLRTKPGPRKDFPIYLDPRDCFFTNLEKTIGERCRSHMRSKVALDCQFSRETDPSLSQPEDGVVRDISLGGCFINSKKFFPTETFVNLRIPHLDNPRPIFCSVRWSHENQDTPDRTGMGVMFIDILESQLKNIRSIQVIQGVEE